MKLKKLLKVVQTDSKVYVLNADDHSIKFSGIANDLYMLIKKNSITNYKVSYINAVNSYSTESVVLEIYVER